MSGFFDSEMVKESLFEMEELQHKLLDEMFKVPFFTKDQKREHLNTMKKFLEKQKLFIFRLSLSNDSEAVEMKQRILESAQMFGLKEGDGIETFFDIMQKTIDKMEKSLDD